MYSSRQLLTILATLILVGLSNSYF